MIIRRATLNDVSTISSLGASTFYDAFVGTCTDKDMEEFLETYFNKKQVEGELSNADDYFYIAEIDNKAVGYLRMSEDNTGFEKLTKYKALELKRLYVDKNYHGKGIAQALMDVFLKFAVTHNFEVVWLGVWEYNHRAKKFYAKYGFKDSGYTHPFPIGNTPQTDLWYWKFVDDKANTNGQL